MVMNSLDAGALKNAFLAGARCLEANKERINELNVFPVPDGDTGTNMSMTMLTAAREVEAITDPTIAALARAIASGSLRGARGNSGVILSQLFRGISRELGTADLVTTQVLSDAFNRGVETAYKAVMKPKEGTILTVARGMAEKASQLAPETDDIIEFAREMIAHGEYVLSQTPEMLPVLKEAGVVDSGGQGLIEVARGCLEGLEGNAPVSLPAAETAAKPAQPAARAAYTEKAEIRFGYCTEFLINLQDAWREEKEQDLKSFLSSIGDSLVVVADDEIVKVHVHTNDPGKALQKALTLGSLSRIKIDNMREEHEERLIQNASQLAKEQRAAGDSAEQESAPAKKSGFVAVCAGEGLCEIFRGIGADELIEGGQTMNPSTEDILRAVDRVHAKTVYLLPNNKNIILAARQAQLLAKGKQVVVIPSQTVPQGIAALINYSPDLSAEENLGLMEEEMKRVRTGQVTYAVRDTSIDGREIACGDLIGLGDGGLLAVGKNPADTAFETLRAMVTPETELITVYYGNGTPDEEAKALCARAQEAFPSCEVECHDGGQPVYYYLMSAE